MDSATGPLDSALRWCEIPISHQTPWGPFANHEPSETTEGMTMRSNRIPTSLALAVTALPVLIGCAEAKKTTGADTAAVWRLVPQGHFDARLEEPSPGNAAQAHPKIAFAKTDDERRLLALETRSPEGLTGAKALAVRYRLHLTDGDAPRLALILFEDEGGVWFKVALRAIPTGGPHDLRLPLTRLAQAAFSQDDDGELQRDRVARAWLGLALDGSVVGTFELLDATFTAEPFRPTRPLRLTDDGPGPWHVAKDAAVQARLTTLNEGPGGKPCMKFEFTFPLGRHMYALPRLPVPEAEYDSYKALRFTYRATLPKGIDGLLVTVFERDGSQYCAEPAPPASGDWRTVTLPFERFRLGAWSQDENGRLDLADLNAIVIGLHGTARAAPGTGTIRAADVELVP